ANWPGSPPLTGANLRVNVYQPSKSDRFTSPTSSSGRRFGACWRPRLVGTTEPVLAAVLGLANFMGTGCGRTTVRVAPDGRILPCTYWPESHPGLTDLESRGEAIVDTPEFRAARQLPAACAGCPCRGGCAGRRAILGQLGLPDPYCPFARGDR